MGQDPYPWLNKLHPQALSLALLSVLSAIPRCARALPYNAEINQRHQEGCQGESVGSASSPQVAPVSGLGDESEEGEVLGVIELKIQFF